MTGTSADDITWQQELDARGLLCPLPVLKARKRLQALPAGLKLDLISPTHASRDRTVMLRQIQGNTYTGQLENRIEGRRYVELSDPANAGDDGWRLTGEVHLAPGQPYQITAQ